MMDETLKPMFIVKPRTVSQRDIARAEKSCGVIIIECSEPEAARYSEAPFGVDLGVQAQAALDLMRLIIRPDAPFSFTKADLKAFLLNGLLEHSRPDSVSVTKSIKK